MWADSRHLKTLAIYSATTMIIKSQIEGTPPLRGVQVEELGKIFLKFDGDFILVIGRQL